MRSNLEKWTNELVSIIVPIYNAKKHLKRCLDAILQQTYRNLEILLIDDGSRDSSYDMCMEYYDIDKRVRVFHKENEGVSKTRNLGIDLARGKYLCFFDSDDYITENMITRLVTEIEENKAELVTCNFYDVIECGIIKNTKTKEGIYHGEEITRWLLEDPFSYYSGVLWNKLYLRSINEKKHIRFCDDTNLGEDFMFNLQYLRECKKIVFIPDSLYYYVQTNDMSLSKKPKDLAVRMNERQILFHEYKSYFKEMGMFAKYEMLINHYIEEYVVAECVTILLGKDNTMKKGKHGKVLLKERIAACKLLYSRCILGYGIKGMRERLFRITFFLKSIQYEASTALRSNYPVLCTMRIREVTPIRFIYILYERKLLPHLKYIRKKRNILLFCDSTTMEEHLLDYYENTKDMSNLAFYLFYDQKNYQREYIEKRTKKMVNNTKIQVIKSQAYMKWKPWDLVVCADVFLPPWINKYCVPTLYVNHGLHIISFNEGENLYTYSWGAYGNGESKFTKMLESNKCFLPYIIKSNPGYQDVIECVGWKKADAIRDECLNYNKYRKILGIKKEEKLITVFGTWHKESLFHKVGDSLINQAKELMTRGYRFVLSIHPREYMRYDDVIQPLGEYVDEQASEGFIIRKPEDPVLSYLIASDVIISDYSSMYELALIADKPLILSDFSDQRVWKHSIARRLKKKIPIFYEESNLEQCIERSLNDSGSKAIYQNYRDEIVMEPGTYKRRVQQITKELIDRRLLSEKN